MSHLFDQLTNLACLTAVFLAVPGLGLLVTSRFNGLFSGFGEKVFFSAGLGFAIASNSIFILGVFQLLNAAALSFLFVVLTALAIAGWARSLPLPGLTGSGIKPGCGIEKAAALFTG